MIIYLRINGAVQGITVDGILQPTGRRWDQVPAVGDLVVEHPLSRELPAPGDPRYVVSQRTFLMWNEPGASYPFSPSGVLLDLTQVPDTPKED